MRKLELSDDEIMLLDGKVNADAQKIIDDVKKIHLYDDIGEPILAEIIKIAVDQNELKYTHRTLFKCGMCGLVAEYPKYKSGPRKGKINLSKSRNGFFGTAFHDGFIIANGYSNYGFCSECGKIAHSKIVNFIVDKDLPVDIHTERGKYIRENERECFSCHAKIWEFDMKPKSAVMQGNYYAICPECGAVQVAFGAPHKSTGNHRAAKKDTLMLNGNCWQRK